MIGIVTGIPVGILTSPRSPKSGKKWERYGQNIVLAISCPFLADLGLVRKPTTVYPWQCLTGNGIAYAECQVENNLMSIKIIVVVAKALVHREICGWFTPSGVGRVERKLTGP